MASRHNLAAALVAAFSLISSNAGATHFLGANVVDKDYLMLHFRDGEVRYRDNGTGSSAYLGHSFAEGDDTLKVFGEFTPRETMRGKMALLGYLYGIRK